MVAVILTAPKVVHGAAAPSEEVWLRGEYFERTIFQNRGSIFIIIQNMLHFTVLTEYPFNIMQVSIMNLYTMLVKRCAGRDPRILPIKAVSPRVRLTIPRDYNSTMSLSQHSAD